MNVKQMQFFLSDIAKRGSILGMESIVHLCEKLHNPQNKIRCIHIAGTNGKGSTGAFLEQALTDAGYKVGRYSSPAVFEYEEIYKINQQPINSDDLAEIMGEVKNGCDQMVAEGYPHPTVFEVETAAAFLYFYKEQCDFALIEVGMGGRTDATNVIRKPILSVITSISMDHTQFLGTTLSSIAQMKAGIIKEHVPVVALLQQEEVQAVLKEEVRQYEYNENDECDEYGSKQEQLFFADASDFHIISMDVSGMIVEHKDYGRLRIGVSGSYQLENMTCALKGLEVLSHQGYIKKEELTKMLASWEKVKWPGRFECILSDPLCIIDGCHNENAAIKLAETIHKTLDGKRIHFIIGVLADKDYEGILKHVLPLGNSAECITPNNVRALDKGMLKQTAKNYLSDVTEKDSIPQAVDQALLRCVDSEDVIVAFGSLSYLGEVKKHVNEIRESIDRK